MGADTDRHQQIDATLSAVDRRLASLLEFGAQQAERESKAEALRAAHDLESEQRWERRFGRLYRVVLPALTLVLGSGGGYAAYQAHAAKKALAGEAKPSEVRATVNERAADIEQRIEKNRADGVEAERKIRKLGEALIELGDEQAAATEYLGDKIDKISPRARGVTPPPAVQRRKDRQAERDLGRRVDDLFGK